MNLHTSLPKLWKCPRRVCDEHEWDGWKCTFHALSVLLWQVWRWCRSQVWWHTQGGYSSVLCNPQTMKLNVIKGLQDLKNLFTPFSNEATQTGLRHHKMFSYVFGQNISRLHNILSTDLHYCSLTWLTCTESVDHSIIGLLNCSGVWNYQCMMAFLRHLKTSVT